MIFTAEVVLEDKYEIAQDSSCVLVRRHTCHFRLAENKKWGGESAHSFRATSRHFGTKLVHFGPGSRLPGAYTTNQGEYRG